MLNAKCRIPNSEFRILNFAFLLGPLLLCASCQTPGGPGTGEPVVRDDVVAIRQFYEMDPWVRDDEGRIVGIRSRVYFVAATRSDEEVPKGVFVPGTIRAQLFAVVLRPDGRYERQAVHEWTLDQQQARGYRVTRRSAMGESYGLVYRWPPSVDVSGKEVQVVLSYQRQDGEIISHRGSRFPVPVSSARF